MAKIIYRGNNSRIRARADALGMALMQSHHQAALALLFETELGGYIVDGAQFSGVTILRLYNTTKTPLPVPAMSTNGVDEKLWDYVSKHPELVEYLETYTTEELASGGHPS